MWNEHVKYSYRVGEIAKSFELRQVSPSRGHVLAYMARCLHSQTDRPNWFYVHGWTKALAM
jgi:hypothetical protein